MEAYCQYACVDKDEVICQLPSRAERVGRRTQLALARAAECGLNLAAAAGGDMSPRESLGISRNAQLAYDELGARVQACIDFHRRAPN